MRDLPWLLGIDTSNYTTSLAAVDFEGNLLDDRRAILPVPSGDRGLRQSEACFEHLRRLPELFRLLRRPQNPPLAVAVSVRPRPTEESYMPVFLVGSSFANLLSEAWHCPLLSFSHQEGHLRAGITSAGGPKNASFLALHLSGGTTELLRIERNATSFAEELLGGSIDLHVGQFVDRVGVALGLPFPAGPHLERLAQESCGSAEAGLTLPAYCSELKISFSGAESQAQRLIRDGVAAPEIARAVERCIARSLEKLLRNAFILTGLDTVLLVGGVASNAFIRSRLQHRLAPIFDLWFATPALSSDNAVGIAWLGLDKLKNGSK